jgi:hypothetical protein
MSTAITIDTLEVLEAAQKLYHTCTQMKSSDMEKAKEIARVADAGFSAVIPYIKDRQAPVMRKHYDAMKRMIDYAKELK